MRILVLIISFVLPVYLAGQISFYKVYSDDGYDKGYGIVQLQDSSYMLTGSSSSFDNNAQVYLLHIDSLGNYIWSNSYGGAESDVAKRILYQPGFGYFIAGTTNSFGNGAYDALLMKIDENGLLEWQKSYGQAGWDQINDAVLTKDTGVVMVGQLFDSISQSMNLYVIRTNKNGDTLWTKNMGGMGEDEANSVIRTQDSLYIVGGSIYVQDSLFTMGYLFKIDDLGNVIWSDTLGDSFGPYEVNDLVEVPTGINIVGGRYDNTLSSSDNYTARYDLNGNKLFEDTYQSPGNTVLDQIGLNGNNNSLFIGYRYIDGTSFQDGYDIALARFTFGLFWDNHAMVVNNPLEEKIEQIAPTIDGGIVAVGFNSFPVNGGNNIFVIKLDSNDVFPSISSGNTVIPIVDLETVESNGVELYPNPFVDYIKININHPMDVILTDAYGKILEEWKLEQSEIINLEHLRPGIYYVFNKQRKSKAIKIIK